MREILAYKKVTDNKIRWDADVDGAPFELYVPKWRVPEPVPGKIAVQIYLTRETRPQGRKLKSSDISGDPRLKKQAIYAEVEYKEKMTKTIRYDPKGNNKDWEIGSPYIPLSLLPSDVPKRLYIIVEWR